LFVHVSNENIVTCMTEGRRYYATLLSLLGNSNISMDKLATPVLLVTITTNSREASVLYREDNTQQ
jgi:hypothetical protein